MNIIAIVLLLLFGIPLVLFAGTIAVGLVAFLIEGLIWIWSVILRIHSNSSMFGPSK